MAVGGALPGADRSRIARPVSHATRLPVPARPSPVGYRYFHHAVDDHSRVAYSEVLDDERKATATGFWTRANRFLARLGVTITAVMTGNGSCYRSHAFAEALGEDVKHKKHK